MLIKLNRDYDHKSNHWKAGETVNIVPSVAKKMEKEGVCEIIQEGGGERKTGIDSEDYETAYAKAVKDQVKAAESTKKANKNEAARKTRKTRKTKK